MSDFWADRPVLVTGGCGFIGSHLTEALLAAGARVKVIGRYNSRSFKGYLEGNHHENLEVLLGDVADAYFVNSAMSGVDTAFHLAALIGIPYSYVAPAQYVQTNVAGTLAVLEAGRTHGTRRIVHTSTSETYGTAQYTPIDEAHPLVGQSPYSATKISADKMAESYHLSFELPVATIRPFNTYGPRQSMRAIIPTIMAQALFADEIRVGSLDPVRDMNYVADTVNGFMLLGESDGVDGGVFNVGSGVAVTIGDLVDRIQAVAGVDKPVIQAADRIRPAKSEVGALLADYSKAAEIVGYKPAVSLDEGLQNVRTWMESVPPADPTTYRV